MTVFYITMDIWIILIVPYIKTTKHIFQRSQMVKSSDI
jgi:hypothetical protein